MSLPKPLARALKAFGGVLVAFVIFIFVINLSLFDQTLDPEIAARLDAPAMPPAEQNAYVALWGMPAAEGLDIVAVGNGLLNRHDEKAKTSPLRHELTDDDLQEFYQRQQLDTSWPKEFERCNPRAQPGCLRRMQTAVSQLENDTRAQLAIKRYQQIIAMPLFQEPYFDSPYDRLPDYGELMAASQLHLAILYFKQSPEFLPAVAQDMQFWKKALDAKSSLVTKMVAVASIWKNVRFLSEHMATRGVEPADAAQIQNILKPLTATELNIAEAWKYESHFFMSSESFDDPAYFFIFDDENYSAFSAWLQQSFEQVNATKNLSYHTFWRPLEMASGMTPNALYTLMQSTKISGKNPLDCCRTEKAKAAAFFPMNFYNMMGKASINKMDWSPIDYVERVFDLQGMLYAANVQLEIALADNPNIESLVNNSSFKNPHTLQAMEYNADNNSLSFQCQDKAGVCEIRL